MRSQNCPGIEYFTLITFINTQKNVQRDKYSHPILSEIVLPVLKK